jgi:hypothetical protein
MQGLLPIVGLFAIVFIVVEGAGELWNALVTRRIDERRRADIALLQHLIQEARKAGIDVVERNEVG